MREIFTTFYEENCYAKENLKKILYIYYKKYLRFNPEIEELHKKINDPDSGTNPQYLGMVRRALEYVKNASMETFFSQIVDIEMPTNLLVKNGKAPIGMKQKRKYIYVKFRYDLHKMKSCAYGMMTITHATFLLKIHNYYEQEHQYHVETFFCDKDSLFFKQTYGIEYNIQHAKDAVRGRSKRENQDEKLRENHRIFEQTGRW